LQYQRPRASWENEPDLIRPSISRCFQSWILQPLNLTIAPATVIVWFLKGTHPRLRFPRHRSLAFFVAYLLHRLRWNADQLAQPALDKGRAFLAQAGRAGLRGEVGRREWRLANGRHDIGSPDFIISQGLFWWVAWV
jgi:hypothetical protein